MMVNATQRSRTIEAVTRITLCIDNLSDDERVEAIEIALVCALREHLQRCLTVPNTFRAARRKHMEALESILFLISGEPTFLNFDLARLSGDLKRAIENGDKDAQMRLLSELERLRLKLDRGER